MKYITRYHIFESNTIKEVMDLEDIFIDLYEIGFSPKVDYQETYVCEEITIRVSAVVGKFGVSNVKEFEKCIKESFERAIEYIESTGFTKISNDLRRGIMKAHEFPFYLQKRKDKWVGDGIRYHDGTNSREGLDFINGMSNLNVFIKEVVYRRNKKPNQNDSVF